LEKFCKKRGAKLAKLVPPLVPRSLSVASFRAALRRLYPDEPRDDGRHDILTSLVHDVTSTELRQWGYSKDTVSAATSTLLYAENWHDFKVIRHFLSIEGSGKGVVKRSLEVTVQTGKARRTFGPLAQGIYVSYARPFLNMALERWFVV
jgi:hypothetical protein